MIVASWGRSVVSLWSLATDIDRIDKPMHCRLALSELGTVCETTARACWNNNNMNNHNLPDPTELAVRLITFLCRSKSMHVQLSTGLYNPGLYDPMVPFNSHLWLISVGKLRPSQAVSYNPLFDSSSIVPPTVKAGLDIGAAS